VPKGVILTHANILANVDSLDQIFPMERGDCFIGVLPFFPFIRIHRHAVVSVAAGLFRGVSPESMDAKTVGELAGEYRANMLISTPDVLQLVPAPVHA
jgi:long-subunit acyl-CoA synthetase (AMP-forming)